MSDAVALDIDGDGEAGDVGGHCFGVYGKRGGVAAEAQRSDANPVNSFQHISLKFGDFGVGVWFAGFS